MFCNLCLFMLTGMMERRSPTIRHPVNHIQSESRDMLGNLQFTMIMWDSLNYTPFCQMPWTHASWAFENQDPFTSRNRKTDRTKSFGASNHLEAESLTTWKKSAASLHPEPGDHWPIRSHKQLWHTSLRFLLGITDNYP